MAYYTKDDERENSAKIANLQRTIVQLVIDMSIISQQLTELNDKLIEAQARNRKLDWLLTEAMEKL